MTRFRSVIAVCLGLALGAVANTTAAHGSGSGPGYGGYGYGYGPHMGPGYGPGLTGPRYGPGPHYYGPGMMGPGYGRPHGAGPMGPGYGQHGYGPGMMGPGYGQGGYGPGMMGPYGEGMYGSRPRPVPDRNLSADDVRAQLEHWLQMHGLSGLQVGNVSEQDDDTIAAEVTDRDGKVVQRYEFNRHTGAMRPSS